MSSQLDARLNRILDRITSQDFLSGSGLGNEIAFHVFDYAPEDELRVRELVAFLLEHISKAYPSLKVAHVNLFDLVLDCLRERNLLGKSIEIQGAKGNAKLMAALAAPLKPERVAEALETNVDPQKQDLVLVTGVGSAFPLLRSHSLLNCLHSVMRETPLVLFFPGEYSGQELRLFNLFQDDHYYRAFKLVP